jgi:glycosyltransferase involved in cell wall biosynthesis
MIYVQVISWPPPLWATGGTARQSDALIKLFSPMAKVILVTQKRYERKVRAYFQNKDIQIFVTKFDFSYSKPLSMINSMELFKFITQQRDSGEKVVIHLLENKGLLVIQLAQLAKKNHYSLWLSPFGQGDAILNKKISVYKHIYKRIINQSQKIICQNDNEVILYKSNLGDQSKALKLPLLLDEKIKKYFNQKKINQSKTLRIGYLGRNTLLKGILEIIDFCERISDEIDLKLTLAIAGKDAQIEDRIRNSFIDIEVIQLEHTTDRFQIYSKLDLFVILPRVPEETSLAALEAATLGVKILYNKNCLFDDEKLFEGLCLGVEGFNLIWAKQNKNESQATKIRKYYLNELPLKYMGLLNEKN